MYVNRIVRMGAGDRLSLLT